MALPLAELTVNLARLKREIRKAEAAEDEWRARVEEAVRNNQLVLIVCRECEGKGGSLDDWDGPFRPCGECGGQGWDIAALWTRSCDRAALVGLVNGLDNERRSRLGALALTFESAVHKFSREDRDGEDHE